MMHRQTRLIQARQHLWLWVGLIAAAVVFAGCAGSAPPRLYENYKEDGPMQFRRFDSHGERDFFHNFNRKVYHPCKKRDVKRAKGDQLTILEELGSPDWVREKFASFQGETIREWVYTDFQRVVQFHGGRLVFDGPMTDYEQTLIRRGLPEHHVIERSDMDRTLVTMIYTSTFGIDDTSMFTFNKGKLIESSEGN